MTRRVWIWGTRKAVGLLGAFDNIVNVTLSRHYGKPTGLYEAPVPSSITHGWKCQGSAPAPRQTTGVCKDVQVAAFGEVQDTGTAAPRLLPFGSCRVVVHWPPNPWTGSQEGDCGSGVSPVCASRKTCEP